MAYTEQEWADGAAGGTPLSAERLNHMEAGISAAGTTAEWEEVAGSPAAFPPATHTHDAADVSTGTFSTARIPALTISKITNLEARLAAIEQRLDAVEGGAA